MYFFTPEDFEFVDISINEGLGIKLTYIFEIVNKKLFTIFENKEDTGEYGEITSAYIWYKPSDKSIYIFLYFKDARIPIPVPKADELHDDLIRPINVLIENIWYIEDYYGFYKKWFWSFGS